MDKLGRFISDAEIEAVETYQATAEAVQGALDGIYNGWAAVVPPRILTPAICKALEYQIYINQNFLSRETMNELAGRLRDQGVQIYWESVRSIGGGNYGRERTAIRPPRMIKAGEEMRAGNLEITIRAFPDFLPEEQQGAR